MKAKRNIAEIAAAIVENYKEHNSDCISFEDYIEIESETNAVFSYDVEACGGIEAVIAECVKIDPALI